MAPSRKRPGRSGTPNQKPSEPLTWVPGTNVDFLVNDGRLEWVSPNLEFSRQLVDSAQKHIRSAQLVGDAGDYELALSNAYDAARKALAAILADQGLRPTVRGGHVVLLELLRPQFPDSREVLLGFDWLRIRRHGAEYPDPNQPPVNADDIHEAIKIADDVIDLSLRYLDQHGDA